MARRRGGRERRKGLLLGAVAGTALDAAVYAAGELEETARLHLLLRGQPVRLLTEGQVAELREAFPA